MLKILDSFNIIFEKPAAWHSNYKVIWQKKSDGKE